MHVMQALNILGATTCYPTSQLPTKWLDIAMLLQEVEHRHQPRLRPDAQLPGGREFLGSHASKADRHLG